MTEPIITSKENTIVLTKDDIQALARPKPKMPQIQTPVDLAGAIRAINQIKEVLETRNGNRGSQIDAGVTFRDLLANGLANLNINGTTYGARPDPGQGNVVPVGPQNDVSIPPAPTGLRLMGAITNVIGAWDRPNFRNYGYTEVWRSATDNLGEATMIYQTPAFVFADSIGSGAGFYYWIRFVSTANIAGPFNAQAGTYGKTGQDASYLLDVLAANPPAGVNYNPLLYVQDNPNLVIDGTPIPVGVYMNTAYMRALSVTNAMIANLAVDNAKIVNLDAVKITAGDIAADRMRANIVEAAVGRFNTLSALSASLGTVQIDSNGWLRTAGVSSVVTGNGLWMGYDAGTYKFRIGNPAGDNLLWDGNKLTVTGDLYSTGNGTFRGTFITGGLTGVYSNPAGSSGTYAGPDGFMAGYAAGFQDVGGGALLRLDIPGNIAQLAANTVVLKSYSWNISDTGTATFRKVIITGDDGTTPFPKSAQASYRSFGSNQGANNAQVVLPGPAFVTIMMQVTAGQDGSNYLCAFGPQQFTYDSMGVVATYNGPVRVGMIRGSETTNVYTAWVPAGTYYLGVGVSTISSGLDTTVTAWLQIDPA